MDTTDAERLERRLSELENYVLALERQIKKLTVRNASLWKMLIA